MSESERTGAVDVPLCRPCGGSGVYGEGNCYYCRGVGRVAEPGDYISGLRTPADRERFCFWGGVAIGAILTWLIL